MQEFLVESYEPGGSVQPSPGGSGIAHLRSIFLPQDEVCLHMFAAASREALREALERAAFSYERIVDAVTRERAGGRGEEG